MSYVRAHTAMSTNATRLKFEQVCPECGGVDFFEDQRGGDLTCTVGLYVTASAVRVWKGRSGHAVCSDNNLAPLHRAAAWWPSPG